MPPTGRQIKPPKRRSDFLGKKRRSEALAEIEEKPSDYESRTKTQRLQRYVMKGFRRNRKRKTIFLVMNFAQFVLFIVCAVILPSLIDGGSIDQAFTGEEQYYAAIITLGGFCSFVFGLSSILRCNVFEMVAAMISSMISTTKLLIVFSDGLRHPLVIDTGKVALLMVIVLLNLFAFILMGAYVVRSFGWTLYLKIGSHQHLRSAFQNFLIFTTATELDAIFLTFLGFVQLAFFSEQIYSRVICLLGMLYNYLWAIFSFYCVRREIVNFFPVGFIISGVWTHPYLIYKLFDMLFLRPSLFVEDPRSSIVITILLSVIFRIVLVTFGFKCSKSFKIGLQERLDEIGVLFGGEMGEVRRVKYKRDKVAGGGRSLGRNKALAAGTLGMLSGESNQFTTRIAGKSDDEIQRELRIVFEMFDTDGSGEIDADEFLVAMKGLGQDVTQSDVDALMAKIDKDNSGSIDFDEFFSIVKEKLEVSGANETSRQAEQMKLLSEGPAEARSQHLKIAFDKHASGGEIDSDELVLFIRSCGVASPVSEIVEWIVEYDEDRKGALSFDEFKVLYTNKIASWEKQKRKMEMEKKMTSTVHRAGGDILARMDLCDRKRLELKKRKYPADETTALAQEYKSIAADSAEERTSKLSNYWSKHLIDELLKNSHSSASTSLAFQKDLDNMC